MTTGSIKLVLWMMDGCLILNRLGRRGVEQTGEEGSGTDDFREITGEDNLTVFFLLRESEVP